MKQIKDIKRKLKLEKWDKYYHQPDYVWSNNIFYLQHTFSEDFIREFKDKVDWMWISKSQTLSEEFIEEFKDRVNWKYISEYQTLSEDFIREFQNKVSWRYISTNQLLSENFKEEFKEELFTL